MNQTETNILNVAEATVKTIENPSAPTIIDDIELVLSLVKQLRAALKVVHPSVGSIVKLLF